MTRIQRTLVLGTNFILVPFVAYGIFTWVRVLEIIPYSTDCATSLVEISQRSAMVRPFFLVAFAICAVTFILYCHRMPKGWRIAYVVSLGIGTALIVAPWLVRLL